MGVEGSIMYQHIDKYEALRHSPEYENYMDSYQWELVRNERIHRYDGGKCQMCGRGEADGVSLQVHHLSYERLGHENIGHDLVTLCVEDHKKIHRLYKRSQRPLY